MPALPCAAFVTPDIDGQVAASGAQEALLVANADGTVSVTYRVTYAGNAADFAWIIPVPGPVVSVSEGTDVVFEALAASSSPVWDKLSAADGPEAEATGCGCGADMSKSTDLSAGDAEEQPRDFDGSNGIDVTDQGYAGDFAYTVLDADDAGGLLAWLEANGYAPGVSAPAIQAYVDDPSVTYRWVAVQLRPEVVGTGGADVVLPPLTIQWGADDGAAAPVVAYPSRMASTSMLDEVRTTLYVSGMGTPELGADWSVGGSGNEWGDYALYASDPSESAADTFTAELRRVGGSARGYWYTWGDFPAGYDGAVAPTDAEQAVLDGFVARFDGIHAPAAHTSDVVFSAGPERFVQTVIAVPANPSGTGSAAWVLPVGVLGWMARRRGERSAPKR
jgi:hypothetical protein